VPTVAVGNLAVGGSGKTPIAAWIARYYADEGLKPGIILRGYGGDEADVHRKLVSGAVVIENPDRVTGASQAVSHGAEVIVLDDAFQRLDIERDLNIAVVSAESRYAPQWTLPAGPWREGWGALRRADLVIVTRKLATTASTDTLLRRVRQVAGDCPVAVARLRISGFEGLRRGAWLPASTIDGADVVAAAGIADPDTFAGQCKAMGASVRLVPWNDHRRLSESDIRQLVLLGRRVDFVIVTEKDAVKMRERWPDSESEPLVARLEVVMERGGEVVRRALDSAVADTIKRVVSS